MHGRHCSRPCDACHIINSSRFTYETGGKRERDKRSTTYVHKERHIKTHIYTGLTLAHECTYTLVHPEGHKSTHTPPHLHTHTHPHTPQVQLLVSERDIDNFSLIKKSLEKLKLLVEEAELWVQTKPAEEDTSTTRKGAKGVSWYCTCVFV